MAKFEYVEWLFWWLLETLNFDFDWDSANSEKSLNKHGISDSEIEEVFMNPYKLPLGLQFEPPVKEERLAILGESDGGKILLVVFTLRGNKIRPISARFANRKERSIYEKVC